MAALKKKFALRKRIRKPVGSLKPNQYSSTSRSEGYTFSAYLYLDETQVRTLLQKFHVLTAHIQVQSEQDENPHNLQQTDEELVNSLCPTHLEEAAEDVAQTAKKLVDTIEKKNPVALTDCLHGFTICQVT